MGKKWIKKVAATPLNTLAKVINSFSTGDDKTTNAPSIQIVENALAGKQANLTFDSTPTSGSSNPVTSGGVYNALSYKHGEFISTNLVDVDIPVIRCGNIAIVNAAAVTVNDIIADTSWKVIGNISDADFATSEVWVSVINVNIGTRTSPNIITARLTITPALGSTGASLAISPSVTIPEDTTLNFTFIYPLY